MLVVDDSVVIRRLVSQVLTEDSVLDVVGSASNGSIAMQRIPQVNPDVITLDIEMPVMDGMETLRQIRKQYPHVYVIMFSTLTERGASATLDALLLGADDYVTKPSDAGSLDSSMVRLREELIPKIKQFFQIKDTPIAPESTTAKRSVTPPHAPEFKGRISVTERKVVAIGISTGGPNALGEIIPMFPANFPLPILIVQHMPPVFTHLLADRLQAKSRIRVSEASEQTPVEPGTVLIAPGNYHMRLARTGSQVRVKLDQGVPENSCRPAVDVLFRSVCEVYGGNVVAAILTGMGHDGMRGVAQLKEEGAYVIAQNESSSVVWGMPGAVVSAGLADAVLDLKAVVPEILKQAGR